MNYKTQRYSLWGLLLLASTLSVNAAPRSKAAMERAAKAILTQKAIGSSARTAPNRGQFKLLKTKGETERSYLYTADAATAILTVLLKGELAQAYNAADEATYCSIAEMAWNGTPWQW